MAIYYFYFCSLFIMGLINISTKGGLRPLLFLASLIILTVIGFRYEIGVDWLLYRDLFNGKTITLALEPGYQFISLLVSLTGISFWLFVTGITFFSLVVMSVFFKRLSVYPVFCLAMYFALTPIFNVDMIRQVLAVSFFYIGFMYLIKNKKTHYYVYVLIAATFHISAALLLILPFIIKDKNTKALKILLLPGIILAVAGVYPIEIIIQIISALVHNSYTEKLISYTTPANISPVITFSFIFKIILISFFFLRKEKIKSEIKDNSHLHVIENFIIFMVFLDIYIGRFGTISSRLDEYFLPAFVCMAAWVIYSFDRLLNRISFSLFIIFYLLVSFYRLSQDEYFKDQFIPYQNYLMISMDTSHLYDKSREQSVDYHWKTRDK